MTQRNCATTVPRGDLTKWLRLIHGPVGFRYPYKTPDAGLSYSLEDRLIAAIDKRARAASTPEKAPSK